MSHLSRKAAVLLGSLGVTAAVVIGMATPASAAEQIDSMQVAVTVNADTTFDVVETIAYDFGSASRHGIFRDIPTEGAQSDGTTRSYGITVSNVTMDGRSVPYSESDQSPYLELKIGDPDFTITGQHTYVISYTVTDGLSVVTADELKDPANPPGLSAGDVTLYWNLVGNAWPVGISSATGTVRGPGTVIATACYSGPQGSRATCPTTHEGTTSSFGPVSLNANEGMTSVTAYPGSAFTRAPTPNIVKPKPSPLVGIAAGLVPMLLLIFGPIFYAISRKREDAGVVLPAAPPQYAAPDGLTAAEMDATWKGSGCDHSKMLVATLVDLAARRWINLATVDGSLQITWLGTGKEPMKPWEESLVGAVLKGQQSAVMSGYDKPMADLWASTCGALVADGETSGRRNPKGDAPDQRWNWLMVVTLAAIGLGILLAVIGLGFIAAGAFTIAVGSLIGFVAARIITPRKETEQSAQFQAKVRGFEKVLGTDAAESRREFAQRINLPPEAVFATMLPYAIVFGLESAWMGAYPDLTPDQLENYGFYYFGAGSMYGLIHSGTTGVASAMTAPSTSSGSGFGGGGFSGGGGGGGGGGSW